MNRTKLEDPSLPPVERRPEPPRRRGRFTIGVVLVLGGIALVAALFASGVLSSDGSDAQPAPSGGETTPTPVPFVLTSVPPLPSPSSVPTLASGVQRVVIARFAASDASFEASQTIEGSLLAALASEGLTDSVQVVRVPDEVGSNDAALDVMAREGGTMLIWGRVEADSVRARTTPLHEARPELQRAHDFPAPSSIVFPADMEIYLSRDLGADVTFLSLVTIGQLDLLNGDLDAAHAHFQSALLAMPAALPREARDRGIGVVNYYFGLAALGRGESLEALQAYSQTVRLYDGFASAYVNRGNVYFELGDHATALVDYDAALEREPGHPAALGNRVRALVAMGDLDGALLAAEQLATQMPDDAASLNLRGLVRYVRGDYERALADFERALDLESGDAAAQFNVGVALDALGRGDESVAAFDALLAAHPDDALAFIYRGDAYLHQGLLSEAVTDYDEALARDIGLVVGYQRRARYYIDRGNYDVALVDLRTALAEGGEDVRTFSLQGEIYAAQDDFAAAAEAYDAALALDASDAASLAGRGGVRRVQRTYISAREDLETALALGGPTPTLQKELGLVYIELGQYDQALEAFEYVVAETPDDPAGHAGLALALEAQPEQEAAEAALREARDLDSRIGDTEYLLDELHWSLQAVSRLEIIAARLGP